VSQFGQGTADSSLRGVPPTKRDEERTRRSARNDTFGNVLAGEHYGTDWQACLCAREHRGVAVVK
jgi:hypothetical protein